MKTLFALLLTLGTVSSVFAQSGRNGNSREASRDVVLGRPNGNTGNNGTYNRGVNNGTYNRNGNRNYDYNTNSREMQIQRINREYDMKIEQVRRDRYLRAGQRNRAIRLLEKQRNEELRAINDSSYNQNNGRYDDHRNDKGRW